MYEETNNQINQPSVSEERQPKKGKKLAIFLIVGPIVGLILILIAWSVISFVLSATVTSGPQSMTITLSIVNAILGFLGIICVLGIIIATPAGVILLLIKSTKKNYATN